MIELRTLGTFAIRDSSDSHVRELPLAPRESALLLYLALARPRARAARERVIGVFWPDVREDRARASLRQALYRLRSELGHDVVVSSGEADVELRWDEVECDAVLFEKSLANGDLEGALGHYGGELLAGFHLAATAEFEQWLDGERLRLRQRAIQATVALAHRTENAGNPAGAANWLRLGLEWSPYEESLIRDLTRLLVTIGDRSGAVHVYEVFAERLSRELDLEPSASLRTAIATLRTAEPSGDLLLQTSGREQAVSRSESEPTSQPRPEVRTVGGSAWRRKRVRRLALSLAAAGILGFVVLQGPAGSLVGSAWPSKVSADENRVIVIPFDNQSGDPLLDPLGRMAADWLTQSLQRTGLVLVIDPNAALRLRADVEATATDHLLPARVTLVARAARAGTIVSGSFSRQDGNVVFHAQIMGASDAKVLRTVDPVVTPAGEIGPGLETLRTRVAGALATVIDRRLSSIIASSSPPPTFEAYQEFAEGIDRFLSGGHFLPEGVGAAIEHFERAARLDSTFVMARFWTAQLLAMWGLFERSDSIILSLVPLRDRLPPAERAALEMFVANIRNDPEAALIAARRAAQLAPQSMWSQMAAETALGLGRPREALADLAVYGATGGWLKDWPRYWVMQMDAYHHLGEYRKELRLARREASKAGKRRPAYGPDAFHRHELYALVALGDLDEVDRRTDALVKEYYLARGWSQNVADIYLWVGRELVGHGFADHALEYFEHCVELIPPNGGRLPCLNAAGRYDEVRAFFAANPDRPAHMSDGQAAIAAARLGHRADAERHMARMTESWSTKRDTQIMLHVMQARILALLGERERAVEVLEQVPQRGHLFRDMHTASEFDSMRDDPFIAALKQPTK